MDFLSIFKEAFTGSMESVFTIAKIVIPLMIVMEVLKDLNVLDKLSDFLKPISKILGISKESTFPLIIGLFLGLAYGAGVIIKSVKDGDLRKRDLYLLIIFLVACHSVIEDTLIFVAIGANGWLLLGFRIIIAVVLTSLVARHIDKILIKSNNEIKKEVKE
ncbi:nucleoside recognition domain-containing protein [Thermohalobacter berrensis]|uniref:nucleoside recognition domain-containing protein n=1 Tax=Thermohalobacter berrensis TaxID=99594 RepID=UPI000E73F51F|nr:nucleoside recognition domain-containing protein [Thermohalobacter berrensis]